MFYVSVCVCEYVCVWDCLAVCTEKRVSVGRETSEDDGLGE